MTVEVFTMLLVSGNDEDEVSEKADELIAGEWKVWNDLRFDRYSGNHYIELMREESENEN